MVTFVNTSSGAAPLTYQWNFGINAGVNSTQQHPSTTYQTCGNYNVTLTVTNGNGQQSTIVKQVSIHCKPTASFGFPTSIGCAPVGVAFTNSSIMGGGAITNYVWDFGDGVGGSGNNPSHIYVNPGCKSVTLVVTDVNGCVDDTTVVNAICPDVPPIADFTSTPSVACAAPISVAYTSVNPGVSGPYTYQWTFPGGTPSTSSIQNPSITYSTPGAYYSQLIVTGPNGCADTIKKNNFVIIGANAADFSITGLTGCAPFTVYCAIPPNAQPLLVSWTAVGGISVTPNNSDNLITFNTPGTYQVCVQLTFPGNCIATKCTTVVVGSTPTANFSVSGLQNICAPPMNNVHFTNLSSGTGVITYNWQFPGGTPSSSTAVNPPNVNYTQCGVYSVTLIATSAQGCSDTLVMDSLVHIDCPIASFVASGIHGCIPFDVTFNSTGSFGFPTAWEWNFGDAGNPNSVQSTQQNPTHTYTTSGCFNVRLIITNAQGCKDTLKLLNYVCSGTQPNVNFSANPVNTCIGVPILFTNLSTGIFPSTNYMWDFNGGPPFTTMSTLKNPTYTYTDTGYFDVVLIACNNGCCDTLILHNYVHINPPLAKITVDKSCVNKYDVTLHGETSIGANTYLWSIPGGVPTTSTSPILAVHFATTGTYTATLTVTNNASGCSHTTTQTIQIKNVQADFSITPQTGCAPFYFCINNLSVDASTYNWKIWNTSIVSSPYNGTVASPCLTFPLPGVYTAQLIATDVNGCKDTMLKPNYLTVYGTTVNFSANTTSGCAPLTVNFTDLSTSTTSILTGWSWDFGDPGSGASNYSTLQNPTHIYQNGGMYSVTLAVTDNHGCVNVKTTNSNYITVGHPDIAFFANDSSVCLGTPICFINNTTDVVGSIQYSWNFGDGIGTSGLPTPCYTYQDTGYYDVTLMAQDWWGCKDTLTLPLYIHITTPVTNFIADSTLTICPPLQVNFSNLSSGYDSSTQFIWDFGDGATSTSFDAFHIYTTAGHYDVTLTLTTSNGCVSTITFNNYINITGPSANVTVTPVTGCSPLNVCFYASSNNTSNYIWNFGDGSVDLSNNDTVCYTYSTSGIFYPAVILNDGVGCVYTLPLDSIIVSHVIAGFTLSANDLCNSGTIHFTDTSSSQVALASWTWNFGDLSSGALNNSTQQNPNHTFNSPGTYIVTLIAKDALLCQSTISQTVYIHQLPDAQFTINPNPICPGGNITFTSTSTSTNPITTYQWNFGDAASGVLNNAITSTASHTFNFSGSYFVKLKVFTSFGCTDSLVQTITVNVPPTANAGPDKIICVNGSAQISASGGVTYSWAPSTGLSATNISNPIANPTTTTTYTLTVADAVGCAGTDIVVVNVNPLPFVNAGSDVSICLNTQTTLNASGAITYNWAPSISLSSSTTATVTSSPTLTTQYVLIGTDINGCVNSDTVIVNVNQLPVSNAGTDVAICNNDSTQLNGSGGVNYSWNNAASLNNGNISNPFAHPSITSTYTLVVTDANGCTDDDNVVVTVHPLPLANAGIDQNICINSAAQLNASGGISYSWSPGATLTSSTINNPSATPLTTTTYSVIVTDVNGCSNSDNIIVTVHNYPGINAGVEQSICIGTSTIINAIGGAIYDWSPSNGLNAITGAIVTASPTITTTYNVIGTDIWGCTNSDDIIISVVNAPPANAGNDTTVCFGNPVQLNASGGIGYSWSPSATLTAANISNPTANPVSTTTYSVIVSDANGCSAIDAVTITINSLPLANAGTDQDICINFTAQLSATGGIGYLWSPDATLSDTLINNPIASPILPTTYSVLVTGANGCTASDNVVITVHNNPIVSAGNDVTICYSTSTQLNATGASTYNWLPFTALNNAGIANPTASPTTTTTYVVEGISAWGCISFDTMVVSVLPPPTAFAGTDTAICLLQSTTLHSTGGIGYSWAPANSLNNSLIANPLASPSATVDYIVTVTDTNGCFANDTVNVLVHPLPTINAGPDLFLCVGSSLQLNATGGISYQWSPAQDLDNNLITNPITTTDSLTNYIVTSQDNIGCSNTDTVLVTVIYPLTATAVNKVDVCEGLQTQLSAGGGAFYQWIPAAGLDNANIPNPTCYVGQSTNYMVIVSDGMCFSDTAYVFVQVHPLPMVYAGEDQVVLAGDDVTLSGSGNGTTYMWLPSDGADCPDCLKTIVHPDITTTYTLWITNDFGCSAADNVVIKVGCTADVVFVPNAFSPNGDGNNDVFYVRSKGVKTLNYFRIYDRWGALVFESTDLHKGWDGNVRNKIAMPGVYVWYMEGACANGQKVDLQGNVTMVR
ncbi:hypothetical protein LBMAG27_21440 [Bacteroidota bacterium]|nr:hypothetical protein LBMAG27_21440 [Bacteroidota bacterium]